MNNRIVALLFAVAALSSCRSVESQSFGVSGRIAVAPADTRATDVDFEDGDMIGLTVAMDGGGEYLSNEPMTFGGGVFTGQAEWYSDASALSTLTAYYPYDGAGAPSSFTVAADQRDAYGTSDLMAAVAAGVKPAGQAVQMTFRHLMSKLVVNVDNVSDADIEAVTLKNTVREAKVDFGTLAATAVAAASPSDITMQETEAGKAYRAVVVPQQASPVLEVTAGGRTLSLELATTEFVASGAHTVNARLLDDRLEIASGSGVAFEEGDGYFIYDGERYATITLDNGQTWMAEPLRYIPEGFEPSADPLADSHIWYPYKINDADGTYSDTYGVSATALTDDESIRKMGYLYDVNAALGGVEITVDNCYDYEGAQGICPEGWHIPTRAEFVALCGNSVWREGDPNPSPTQLTDPTAQFYDEEYGTGRWVTINEAGWNFVMTGVRMSTGYATTPRYQLTQICPGNTTLGEEYYGLSSTTYIMSSSCHKPVYSSSTGELSNIQYFSLCSGFTISGYPEGRVSVLLSSVLCGQQLRCVKDAQQSAF